MKKTNTVFLIVLLLCIYITSITACVSNNPSSSTDISDNSSETSSVSDISSQTPVSSVIEVTKEDNAKQIPVLLYHHLVSPEEKGKNTNSIIHTTTEFDRQMALLKEKGYITVTMDDIVQYVKGDKYLPEKSVCITFDDGYKSNAYYAAPILRKYDFCATVFTITKYVDLPNEEYDVTRNMVNFQYVNFKDIEDTKDVLNYQCHTNNLHTKLIDVDPEIIKEDLLLSLERFDTKYFAYPINADLNDDIIKVIKDTGFEAAFTVVRRHCRPGDNIYKIPRYTIVYPMSDEEFMEVIIIGN